MTTGNDISCVPRRLRAAGRSVRTDIKTLKQRSTYQPSAPNQTRALQFQGHVSLSVCWLPHSPAFRFILHLLIFYKFQKKKQGWELKAEIKGWQEVCQWVKYGWDKTSHYDWLLLLWGEMTHTFSTSALVTLMSASIFSKYCCALSASLQSLSNRRLLWNQNKSCFRSKQIKKKKKADPFLQGEAAAQLHNMTFKCTPQPTCVRHVYGVL